VAATRPRSWRTGGETPARSVRRCRGLLAARPLRGSKRGRAAVWIDVGRDDPFFGAAKDYAQLLRGAGRQVTLHLWDGGHDRDYWKQHVDEYLGFYADALARC
jgi:enterochelin esterase-like enzyme